MTSKKKKIIILTGMVALLVLTGVLNIVLNLTADGDVLDVSGTDVYTDFFTSYRDYRTESREQTLMYYDEIIASESTSADAKAEAEASRLQLMQDMET